MEFFAVDPTETHDFDLTLAVLRQREQAARKALQAVPEDELEAAQLAFAEAERAVQTYRPGTGPVFTIGLIPGAKRHELSALLARYRRETDAAKQRALDFDWMKQVVTFAVRGHRNLARRGGAEVPFAGEQRVIDGMTLHCPTPMQIEAYYYGGFLGLLAMHAWEPQALSDEAKNV